MGKTRDERREFLELLMEGLTPEQRQAELAEFERLEDEAERAPPPVKDAITVWIEDHRHPFLGTQPTPHDNGIVFSMKTRHPDSLDTRTMQLAFSIEKIEVAGGPFYETMEELEQKFLSNFPEYKIDGEAVSRIDAWKVALFNIERAGSQIAKNTRRGKGNVVVASTKGPFFLDEPGVYHDGMINNRYKVVRRSYVPEDTLYVLYCGSTAFDHGGFYAPYIDFDGDMSVKNRLVTVPEVTTYGFKMDFSGIDRTSNDN
jgi:hypothetical protein